MAETGTTTATTDVAVEVEVKPIDVAVVNDAHKSISTVVAKIEKALAEAGPADPRRDAVTRVTRDLAMALADLVEAGASEAKPAA